MSFVYFALVLALGTKFREKLLPIRMLTQSDPLCSAFASNRPKLRQSFNEAASEIALRPVNSNTAALRKCSQLGRHGFTVPSLGFSTQIHSCASSPFLRVQPRIRSLKRGLCRLMLQMHRGGSW